jgi:predicted methyltransferase
MDKVITKDGSITYYNEKVRDYYHTKSGAVEEAVEKHVKALNVVSGKVIFDICFGLGYNSAAALDVGPATIYCFENDKEILRNILDIDADFKSFGMIKEFVRGFFEGNGVYEKNGVKLVMLFGDAREKINDVKEKADYVFFDPFSPAKVPEMWTEKFFKNIGNKMKNDGKLSTYSCAGWVRDNMRNSGFEVLDGPVIGRTSPGTICLRKKK